MAVSLSPIGGSGAQFFDNNGVPLTGGKLYSYEAGTTTPKTTYTSFAGTTANTNPIVLDAAGRPPAEIWLTSGDAYKFVLTTSTGTQIGTWDNIYGYSSGSADATTEVQTATAGQTLFVLSTMAYNPGANTLGVYIDGVNQVVGNAYAETSATSVTFVSGLHEGAVVKFINMNVTSADASTTTYEPGPVGSVVTTVQAKLRETVSVKDFGAVGDGVTDDTAAIQAAIDYVIAQPGNGYKTLYFPDGNYSVTTISFAMPAGASGTVSGATFIFDGIISGQATGNYSAVVEVMAGYSKFVNMRVNGNNNDGIESGIHWYTNNINENYPGFVQFENCYVTQCFIGLCVGMLPSQAGTYYGPSATPAKPLAIDAPVSESFVHGLTTTFCLKGVVVEQPNGKFGMTDCVLGGNPTTFPSYVNASSALDLKYGEVSMLGGAIENVWSSAGLLASVGRTDLVGGVTFNMTGVLIESLCPMFIAGNATVRMAQNCNWGVNGDSEFFWVHDSCTKELTVSDSFLLRGQGTGYSAKVVKTVSNLTGTSAVNYNFWANFTNVTFQNCIFQQGGSTYQPLVKGSRAYYTNCLYSVLDGSGVVTSWNKFDSHNNLILGKVDLAAASITAYGVNGSATSGGWTFTVPGGSPSWGKETTGLPTIIGSEVSSSLRMSTGAVGSGLSVTATSPLFYVDPSRMTVLRGFIKSNNDVAPIYIRAIFKTFDGSNSATPYSDLFNGAENQFYANGFQPFELWFNTPNDATQCVISVYAENGGDIQLFGLSLSQG